MLRADLSARQYRLAELAATGLPGPELAPLFELSHKRVRQCLIDLYRLLGVTGRMDLAWWWWECQGRDSVSAGARQLAREQLALLTPGELALARLVGQRLDNAELARRLGLRPKTVRNRKWEICALLELSNAVALARLVWEAGLDA